MDRVTLEDAIKHVKEVADMNYNDAEKFDSNDSVENYMKANCMKCAEQHEKLAEWLEELKSYKELEERLHKIFGEEYTFSLTDVVDTIEMKLSEPDKNHPVNARILTYEDADKWKEYKELEKQGLLVRLPCKVGDTVWVVTSPINVFGYDEYDGDAEYEVYESFLSSVSYYASGEQFRIYAKVTNSFIAAYFRECDFGESIFLTREEAEKKLEEMKK